MIGDWPAGKTATYTRSGTAVPFIISELPGGRAEALFIASPALERAAGPVAASPALVNVVTDWKRVPPLSASLYDDVSLVGVRTSL